MASKSGGYEKVYGHEESEARSSSNEGSQELNYSDPLQENIKDSGNSAYKELRKNEQIEESENESSKSYEVSEDEGSEVLENEKAHQDIEE
jgi:hypothetical protein